MAVLALCRARKSRVTDDAVEYVRLRRNRGWRPSIPPEAIDSHTTRGKRELAEQARRRGVSYERLAVERFYAVSAKLTNRKRVRGVDWTGVLYQELGIRPRRSR